MLRGGKRIVPRCAAAALAGALLLAVAARPAAHEIPSDIIIHAFVKPEGQRVRLLVRIPLKAIQDIEYPRNGDYLDLSRIDAALHHAAKFRVATLIELFEGNTRLPAPHVTSTRVSLESDKSFGAYDTALAHVMGPRLPSDLTLFWEQGLLDVLFEYPIGSDRSEFSIHPAFERLAFRVVTSLRFLPTDGAVRAFELSSDPGLVRLDPRWHQAAFTFVELGFFHILDGIDHLLFLLCLVIPFRRLPALLPIVTSFTVAHSITLVASAYGVAPDAAWFAPLVEVLIAASIVYMALENIVAAQLRRRWLIAFVFGLVHGFGFSFGLDHTLQFAGSHLVTSLLSFNVGVELGQLLVLVVLVPALHLLFRFAVAERIGTILLSAFVAHTAWHWTAERLEVFRQHPWPALPAGSAAGAVPAVMLVVVVACLARFVFSALGDHAAPDAVRSR